MNMPSPMNFKNYSAINNNLLNIYNEVASASMSSAANETKDILLDLFLNIAMLMMFLLARFLLMVPGKREAINL